MSTSPSLRRGGFRPAFWPTVMALPAVLVMLALGTWQVQRLHWKTALIESRVARTTGPAVPFPFTAEGVDLKDLEFRRSRVTGRFDHDHEIHLLARSLTGGAGYQIITPLTVTQGPHAGTVVLVNRGWVPMERRDPATRAAGQVSGEVTVEGVIRLPGVQHWMVPDNAPDRNVWFWTDLPAMVRSLGIAGPVAPVFLEAGPAANPGGLPVGGQTRIDLPNDHLQYAITWYSLAVALAVIWFLYTRRAGKGQTRRDRPSRLGSQEPGAP
ncbi:MAG: SURF1 family protein [Rhodospirillaceae bacterium]|nr:SURF1 family protein [Rhodospirillaceae bacterium]